MKELFSIEDNDRKSFFEVAAYESKKSFEVIEKDYWVVWTLDRLFNLPELSPYLTFKGGTSLSKIFKVIDRFSEDIDVSIEREFFGFDDNKKPELHQSRSQQKLILDKLSETCSAYVQNNLKRDLAESFKKKLGSKSNWSINSDPDESQTLLFHYPTSSNLDGYIRPIVKIELGARAEHWPVSEQKIKSYAKETLNEKVFEPAISIRVLDIERTFWEKATILHQYAHIPQNKALPPRLSRHWYDFFKLLKSDAKVKSLDRMDLLERVVNHKKIYFASSWANYDSARKGSLKLIPTDKTLDSLKLDYRAMQSMFFSEAPKFEEIIATIKNFEVEFNL